jgi:3-oxoadipate enol-lactonase
MTITRQWQASDGTLLSYCCDEFTDPWKSAPTLVLIHPGMGSAERLYAWVPHFARDFRVVRPDLRGHGKSQPGLDKPLDHERLARDLIELFDDVGCERVHCMGAAAGGMVAMQAALRYPQRFASLALVAATAGINPERPQKGNWLARVGAKGVRQFLAETVRERIGDASPAHINWYLDSAEGVTPQFLARFVPLMASEYYPERLSELRCPVMMLVPDPDPMVDAGEYALMRKALPDCRYATVPGASHSMVSEVPDRCAREVREFYKALDLVKS